MNILFYLFSLALLLGQLVRIPLWGNAVIYPHEFILMLLVTLGLWKGRKRMTSFSLKKYFLAAPMMLFATAIAVSLAAWTIRSGFSLPVGFWYFLRLVLYGSLYGIARIYGNRTWLISLFIAGTVFAGGGIIQFFLYPDLRNLMYLGWDPHYFRLFSTLLDPNFAGIIIVLTLFLGLGMIPVRRLNYPGFLIAMVVDIAALVLTFSRSSLLAFAIGCIIYLFLRHWAKCIPFLLGVFLFFVLLPSVSGKLFSDMRDVTAQARVVNWSYGMSLLRTSPIVGLGWYMIPQTNEMGIGAFPNRATATLDSSAVFAAAGTGILGFTTLLYLVIRMVQMGWMRRKNPLAISFLSMLGALCVHSLFVNSAFYPWVLVWILTSAGIVEAMKH